MGPHDTNGNDKDYDEDKDDMVIAWPRKEFQPGPTLSGALMIPMTETI